MATGTLLQSAQQWFDDDGNPLSGGFMYFYAAGTSTPLPTYSDYGLTTANTNPVQLDAGGRPDSGSIFLSSAVYKLVVTDSVGAQVFSQDNINGGTSGGGTSSTWPGTLTNVASNTLVDLGAVGSNFVQITGSVTVNDFGSTASTDNPLYLVTFNNALTITNSASILVRAGVTTIGNNLVTASGDFATIQYLGSGSWKIVDYVRGDGSFNATTITVPTLTVTTTANLP